MITVDIRKQGAAAVITIPGAILKQLNLKVGSALALDVKDNSFVARPTQKTQRKRYSLTELLEGVSEKYMEASISETKWVQEGDPVGNELI